MFRTEKQGSQTLALCPNCGEAVTHVDRVIVTNASGQRLDVVAGGEDERALIDVSITSRQVYAGRRHTITLVMDCEMCDRSSSVNLMQHKGATFVTTT